jgi:hypothetical protein
MDPQSAKDLEWGLREIKVRGERYLLYRRYYDGDHRLAFATKDWTSQFGRLFAAFADNLCPAVVNAVRNRLSVTGFSIAGDEQESGDGEAEDRVGGEMGPADLAWEAWNRNRMDRRQKELFREALIGGDSYAIVWEHPTIEGQAVIYPNRADQCVVRYDEEVPGRRAVGIKAWTLPDRRARANLYYEDRIEKYVSRNAQTGGGLPTKANVFDEWTGAEGTEAAIVPHELESVPVVPFSYDAGAGMAGRSRLTDVLPIQDALNKSLADMLVAMEFQSIPQRWVVGYTPEIDPTTGQEKKPFIPGADRLWGVTNPDARFGQFEAAALKPFIDVSDSFRAETARVSSTPLHYLLLSGSFPSGEALRAAEAPLEAVVQDTKDGFGTSIEETMDLVARVEGNDVVPLSALWRDSTSRGAKEWAETLEIKKALGVPQRQIFRELGYSDPEIEEMLEEEQERLRTIANEGLEEETPSVVQARGNGARAPIISAAATAGPRS